MSVYRLSNELARRGHSVDVIHCIDAYHSLESSIPHLNYFNHPNVLVHSLKSGAGLLSPLLTQQTGYPLFKVRKIRKIIENGGFDVIHFHNISLVGGPGLLKYGNAVKLYTLHEFGTTTHQGNLQIQFIQTLSRDHQPPKGNVHSHHIFKSPLCGHKESTCTATDFQNAI